MMKLIIIIGIISVINSAEHDSNKYLVKFMSLDLKSKEDKNKFIEQNMSKLIEGVNDSYGPILVEELMGRLRKTIDEFNEEIIIAFDDLKSKESSRQNMFKMIKDGNIPSESENEDNSKLTEWEEKIKEAESQK